MLFSCPGGGKRSGYRLGRDERCKQARLKRRRGAGLLHDARVEGGGRRGGGQARQAKERERCSLKGKERRVVGLRLTASRSDISSNARETLLCYLAGRERV